jgi:hypothetical protein
LEIRIEPRSVPLVFLLCHWKSKLGGDDATEALRRSSARVVQRRIRELKEAESGTAVIVMGDLNENHDEFYRRSGSELCALLPDNSEAAAAAAKAAKTAGTPKTTATSEMAVTPFRDFLVISPEKPPASEFFPEDTTVLFSPWEEGLSGGSYSYKGEWETIDHFLLSEGLFTGSGWDYAQARVLNYPPFINSNGTPDTYVPRYGRGLSDHLPLLLYLNYYGGS